MKLDNLWAQLEQDLGWRRDELRLLSNISAGLKNNGQRDRFRRTQLVMLYAHVEGFCKLVFLNYVKAVNSLRLPVSSANDELVASAFEDIFHALQHGDQKGEVFAAKLPEDPKLFIAARRRDFIAEYEKVFRQQLRVPESAVNTESNLGSVVMRRNLFRLGFRENTMAEYDQILDELKNRRNNIAHGSDDSIVKSSEYDRMEKTVFRAMDELALVVIQALEQQSYLFPGVTRFSNDASWLTGEMK